MEDSKTTPEEKNSKEAPLEIKQETKKEENVKAFNDFLEKASNQNDSNEKASLNSDEQISNRKR